MKEIKAMCYKVLSDAEEESANLLGFLRIRSYL
ncbi:hypothetical protein GvMRE_IIg251 [endosymbiont GvMRE of Glomus versiforme]|nr:hypothetical protein GvMRE_IIg251 [endosymbiont GvMRE of Glomus versiforme]